MLRKTAGMVLMLYGSVAHATCEQARVLYEQALQPGTELRAQVSLLERSVATCDSFAAVFALGQAYAQQGDLARGIVTLRQAYRHAESPTDKAWLWATMARLHQEQQHPDEALLHYKTALRFMPHPEIERAMLALEREMGKGVLPAAHITSALVRGLDLRAIGIVPAIDVRVHFDVDSARLTTQGEQQASEIGKALMSAALRGKRVRLIGHTDSRGSEDYNDRLSRERATAVQRYLLTHFSLHDVLFPEGRGKRELLYHNETEEAHSLNRRVEVQME